MWKLCMQVYRLCECTCEVASVCVQVLWCVLFPQLHTLHPVYITHEQGSVCHHLNISPIRGRRGFHILPLACVSSGHL